MDMNLAVTARPAVRTPPDLPANDAANLPEVWEGIARGEFQPHYQPVICLRTMKVIGAETLMRWDHPQRGMLAAAQFLPLIEDNFLYDELSALMLERSLAQCSAWLAQGIQIPLSVNVSEDMLLDQGFADALVRRVTEAGLPPSLLTVEVTESVVAHGIGSVLESVLALRRAGIDVAVDDFGTGRCPHERVERLPVTAIKLNRMLVSGAATRPHLRRLLEAALELAHDLNVPAVAVGVETEVQWELVQNLGFDAAQGHLLCKPMDGEALGRFHSCWHTEAAV